MTLRHPADHLPSLVCHCPACSFRPRIAWPLHSSTHTAADCTEVKSLFQGLGVAAKVVELDDLADGAQVQEAIQALTGRRTVPQASVGRGGRC